MKTSELTGAALNYAVAVCEGFTNLRANPHRFDGRLIMGRPSKDLPPEYMDDLQFSRNWAMGGPIIEREAIRWYKIDYSRWVACKCTGIGTHQNEFSQYGPTQLIATMRCYIASKLGDEVEIPEELRT